jgi:TusA-related sulfurtransferase
MIIETDFESEEDARIWAKENNYKVVDAFNI